MSCFSWAGQLLDFSFCCTPSLLLHWREPLSSHLWAGPWSQTLFWCFLSHSWESSVLALLSHHAESKPCFNLLVNGHWIFLIFFVVYANVYWVSPLISYQTWSRGHQDLNKQFALSTQFSVESPGMSWIPGKTQVASLPTKVNLFKIKSDKARV